MRVLPSVVLGAATLLLLAPTSAFRPRLRAAAPQQDRPAVQAPTVDHSAASLQELKNATYRGVEEAGDSFTLTNGRWEGKPYAPGGASRPSVTFVRDFRLTGDLDGDGSDEAIVLLAANAGGSGEMTYLAAVGRAGRNATQHRYGANRRPRPGARGASGGAPHRVRRGAGRRRRRGVLPGRPREAELGARRRAMLKEGEPVKTGRLTLDTLAGASGCFARGPGTNLRRRAPGDAEARRDPPRSAAPGCNHYFAAVTSGGAPGDIKVGAAGSTRKMCPEAEMTVEQRFLSNWAARRRCGSSPVDWRCPTRRRTSGRHDAVRPPPRALTTRAVGDGVSRSSRPRWSTTARRRWQTRCTLRHSCRSNERDRRSLPG